MFLGPRSICVCCGGTRIDMVSGCIRVMPRPHDCPSAEPDNEGEQGTVQTTPVPNEFLQAWSAEMRKDARDVVQEGSDDSDEESGSGSQATTDSDDDDSFGVVRVGGKENTVSVTYIIGVSGSVDGDADDSSEWEDDEGEQSVESDNQDELSEADPEELAHVAAVIADMINEAMAGEEDEHPRRSRKRRGGSSRRAPSIYVPDSVSEEEGETTAEARAPVMTRSRRKEAESRGRKGPGKPDNEPVKKAKKSARRSGREASAMVEKSKSKDRPKSGSPERYEELLGVLSKSVEGKEGTEMEKELLRQFGSTVSKMKKEKAAKEEAERKEHEKPIRKKNCKAFRRLLRTRSAQNPLEYFVDQPVARQKELIERLKETTSKEGDESAPYTVRILESKAPQAAKALALRQTAMLGQAEDSEEGQKLKNWVDAFTRIPFGNYVELPMRLGVNKPEEVATFMTDARTKLDSVAYGLDDAKTKLMEVLGQWVANPQATGCSIALKGPMGTGKTTLIKEGLSKIIGRPFEFIALGGSTDGCTLEGHSFTYVGSTWGEIVSILLRSKCMNPVIYFDELDKISQSHRGQEISGILTHLTDVAQNNTFSDRYFAGVPLDLSRVVFVFSYNDETQVNPILLNRMFKIETKGYDQKEKAVIAVEYMLPSLLKEYSMTPEDVTFGEDAIGYLTAVVSGDEKGVRDLKRGLTTCLAKLNLLRLGMSIDKVVGKESRYAKQQREITFPVVVDRELASMLVKPAEMKNLHIYN